MPSSLRRAEHHWPWAAPRFFSWRKKYLEDDSPSSAHFTRARTRAPAAAVLSTSAMLMSTDSRASATDVIPASNFFFKWSARRAKRSRSRRLLEALEEQWREIMALINLFPMTGKTVALFSSTAKTIQCWISAPDPVKQTRYISTCPDNVGLEQVD